MLQYSWKLLEKLLKVVTVTSENAITIIVTVVAATRNANSNFDERKWGFSIGLKIHDYFLYLSFQSELLMLEEYDFYQQLSFEGQVHSLTFLSVRVVRCIVDFVITKKKSLVAWNLQEYFCLIIDDWLIAMLVKEIHCVVVAAASTLGSEF